MHVPRRSKPTQQTQQTETHKHCRQKHTNTPSLRIAGGMRRIGWTETLLQKRNTEEAAELHSFHMSLGVIGSVMYKGTFSHGYGWQHKENIQNTTKSSLIN